MPPVLYSGSLQAKKKSDLQEIAVALRLSDQGTKDEIHARIKKHLDANQDDLEDNPVFAGLFGRRKRSVQPQVIPSGRFAPDPPKPTVVEKPKSTRSTIGLDPIVEATPAKDRDMRDVSMFLKHPFSPADSSPTQSPRQALDLGTPSSLPPLPPSPVKSIIEHLPSAADVKAVVQQQLQHQQILDNGNELLVALRAFLSNSQNIWSVTAVGELLYILSAVIPWKTLQIPLTATSKFNLVYPPASTFQAGAFWQVLLHWALPTLIIPSLLGCLISFNPALAPTKPNAALTPSATTPAPAAPLDPLTAAIVRLAAASAYPYAAAGAYTRIDHLDVLGSQWRVLGAAVGLAFAFAEAINGAPKAAAETLVREQRALLTQGERERTPVRPALLAAEYVDEVE